MPTKNSALSIIIINLVLAVHAHTYANTDDVILGKVVKVADGDTITVLEDQTQHRIRLYGIDAPERRQDFSNKAKQFVSGLVFGKQVRVVKQDIDRYGRIVGIVYADAVCVNEELVRNGLAWVYRHYCRTPICVGWLGLETQARDGKMGLWSHPNPMPPWEYRRNKPAK
jgi:micrococcal nuclease